jgi:hypothetical protein
MLANVVAVLTILTALGVVATGILYWRAARSGDVRRVVVSIREFLLDLTAHGGLDTPAFLEDGPRRNEQELKDLLGRLNDRKLREACEAVFESWKRVWASAPPRREARASFLEWPDPPEYAGEDADRAKRHYRQTEEAHACIDLIETALAGVNQLEKFLWRRS